MKFSMYIPVSNVTPGQFQSMQAITEMTQALEKAGMDACCVTDHPAPSAEWLHANGHDALDPFTALAFVAATSPSLMLQTNILVLPYRNPFITAKAAATLQVLSGGRFILGVGSGYQPDEFAALGVDFRERGKLTDEALEVIREIWKGGAIVRKGMHFNAVGNEPRPPLETPPKIWIGGSSNKAIERAAQHGDGWCPFFSVPRLSKLNRDSGIQSVQQLRETIVRISELRSELGRSADFDVAIGPPLRVTDKSQAEAKQWIEALQELQEAGVTWATFNLPHPSRAAYIDNLLWFGEEVISRV